MVVGRVLALVVGCGAFILCGCSPAGFKVSGAVTSAGGTLGNWKQTPVSCHRPVGAGDAGKLMAFSFQPQAQEQPDRDSNASLPRGLPLRLTFSAVGNQVGGTLTTLGNSEGIRLDSTDCSKLDVDGKVTAARNGGEPYTSGTVTLDCMVQGSKLTASLAFQRCQ